MKALYIFIFTVILASTVSAQVTQEWVKRTTSTGNFNDYARAVTYDAAGNVYVTGTGNGDFMTMKYSPAGVVIWNKTYNGPDDDADDANAICVDAAGNVYVTGRSFGNGSGTDFATIKYDPSGNQLWLQRFNGSNNDDDAGLSIAVDASGNVYAGGWAGVSGNGIDFAVVKYSPTGSQLWVKYYNGPEDGNDFLTAMKIDGSGNIYATGKSRGVSNDDYATVKFNPAGTLQWSVRYQSSGADEPSAIFVDASSNVYVTGFGTGTDGRDFVTIKYNNAGIQQWMNRYDRADSTVDQGVGIVVNNSNGNVYVTGFSSGASTASFDIITIGYNTNGDDLWTRSYNGGVSGANDKASSIDIDAAGNIYVTGTVVKSGSDLDYATLKYSPTGVRLWDITYESSLNGIDNATAVKVDNGNIYVTGYCTGSSTGNDYVTLKYSQPIGISNISSEVPLKFSLSQNYPNPFNPVTNIEFSLPNSADTKLTVFDITGKEIAALVNQPMNAGIYNVDFDASHLASGTFFYRIEAGDFTEVKKMILVK